MRHLAKVSLCVILVLSLGGGLPAAKNEYFTDAELELIREAQELKLSIPVYFKLAERRLIFLGVMEKSEKEKEREQDTCRVQRFLKFQKQHKYTYI